jgi:ABC-type transport system involved in multi-copper enzyme maturation permease subunit
MLETVREGSRGLPIVRESSKSFILSEILSFEWRYHSRQAAFLAAAPLFFLLGFALSLGRFGADNIAVNSPYLVMQAFGLLSLLAIFVAAIFSSDAVLRDDEHRMAEIVHAMPVDRLPFFFGRFGGAFLASLAAVTFSGLGMVAGALMPWLPPERVAPMDARPYLAAFGLITLPNVFFVVALVFAVAVWTRKALATYAAAVVLYILYFVGSALTNSPLMAASRPGGGGGALASLLDPFGLTSLFDATRYWTAAEKNARLILFEGALPWNRVLWIAAAFAILALVYRRYDFRLDGARVRKRQRAEPPAETAPLPAAGPIGWPEVRPSGTSWLGAYRSCTRMELRMLLSRSTLFLFFLWLAWAVSEIYGGVLSGEYGSTSYPATGLIVRALSTPAAILGTILILFYGAELFWREQKYRVAAIVDSTPVSSSALIAAKWTALGALLGTFLLGGVAAGVAIQVSKGYFDFQPHLYLTFLYFTGVPLLLYAGASLLVHALSPGRYAGMVFFALFVILSRRASEIGLEHDLWHFAAAPPVSYSDLDGFGHTAAPFHAFMLHWTVLTLLMVTLAAALWRRVAAPWKERIRILARPGWTAGALAAAFLVTGGWIFYNTNIAHTYTTASEQADWRADYEKTYKSIENLPRPRIVRLDGNVDLDPAAQRYRVTGRYTLVNDTGRPIPSLYVAVRREARSVTFAVPAARWALKNDRFGMSRFDFTPPLAPGARTEIRFDLSFDESGFGTDQAGEEVVENGTFLMNPRCFPALGYRGGYELSDRRERKKRGLSGSGAAELAEDGAHGTAEESVDDWIDLRLTVSTAGDQIALAPGHLEASGRRGGRRWFRYRTEAPILNRFAVSSGRYAVARRQHGPVEIEIYYNPSHGVNVPRMLDTAAASLDVLQSHFGAYPHRELRIVEIRSAWPMAGFALPGTVYIREDRGFFTDARDGRRPDLIGRRIAHEVAHQWFGHRVHSGNVEGASMLIESLAKYSELLVLERLRGPGHVRQLLEIELDRYLSGRAGASYAEVPLYKVDNEAYLYYNKGAVVLLAIRDLIGQDAMDRAIRALIQEQRPTSLSLVRHLEAVADPRQAALIREWTQEIVLYDLRIESAQASRRSDGRYDVTVRIAAGKVRTDGRGKEKPLPLAEEIEVAVTDAGGQVIDSRKRRLRSGMNEIRLVTGAAPSAVTVDPGVTRIDRNPLDNVRSF